LELLSNKSDKALDKIQVNTKRRWQVDSGGNCKELNIGNSKEPDLNGSKDDLV